jgi:hypothetical protein
LSLLAVIILEYATDLFFQIARGGLESAADYEIVIPSQVKLGMLRDLKVVVSISSLPDVLISRFLLTLASCGQGAAVDRARREHITLDTHSEQPLVLLGENDQLAGFGDDFQVITNCFDFVGKLSWSLTDLSLVSHICVLA